MSYLSPRVELFTSMVGKRVDSIVDARGRHCQSERSEGVDNLLWRTGRMKEYAKHALQPVGLIISALHEHAANGNSFLDVDCQ